MKKVISFILVLSLALTVTSFSFASSAVNKNHQNDCHSNSKQTVEDENYTKEAIDLDEQSFNTTKQAILVAKKAVETSKAAIEAKIKDLEAQYDKALKSGNTELVKTLKAEILAAQSQFLDLKAELRSLLNQMKALHAKKYSNEERKAIKKAEKNIKDADPSTVILNCENIFSQNTNFKFDTPPVIKAGRTLIPIRAITEGLGATVTWDPQQKVTITKNDITIVITLGSNKALVTDKNGTKEVVMDVKAGLTNNRTYVPLRFVAETLGLKVNWDKDTKTVEIDEDDDSQDNDD